MQPLEHGVSLRLIAIAAGTLTCLQSPVMDCLTIYKARGEAFILRTGILYCSCVIARRVVSTKKMRLLLFSNFFNSKLYSAYKINSIQFNQFIALLNNGHKVCKHAIKIKLQTHHNIVYTISNIPWTHHCTIKWMVSFTWILYITNESN